MNTTIQPQRALVIEAPENPDVIELTVSEVSRQIAKGYFDDQNCLVCTVLKNHGMNVDSIGGTGVTVEGVRYNLIDDAGAARFYEEQSRPYYGQEVVGRNIKLVRRID